LHASVTAIPTGKQNSMAAQNPPSFVMAVVREAGPWSLANAFLEPVRADRTGDLMTRSVAQLDRYWGQLEKMYGAKDLSGIWLAMLGEDGLTNLAQRRVASLKELAARVRDALASEGGRA
jgi:CRISPR system Cascade subunit CasC